MATGRFGMFLALLALVLAALPGLASGAPPLPRYRDGELLVRFKDGIAPHAAARTHATLRAGVGRGFKTARNVYLVTLPADVRVEDALAAYRRDPAVAYAEPNYIVQVAALPDDPQFPSLWNMTRIDAPGAWDLTTGSPDVVVAVPDSGVDYLHPDLAANVFRNEADCDADGLDDDENGFVDDCFGIDPTGDDSDPLDDLGHGTHVAGIVGAVGNNGVGVVGVSWQVKILACKMISGQGSGTLDEALECLDYIASMKARGVNIVATNASWTTSGLSQALLDAVETLQEAGILFVAAAGNHHQELASCPLYPAAFFTPGIVAVAATDASDDLTGLSSFGGGIVHLGAPGIGVLSTAMGGGYELRGGTSMAAPHVAGVAALLKAADPLRDWKTIKNLLLAGGDPNAALDTTTISGRRLNARGALECQDSVVLSGLQHVGRELIATDGVPFVAPLSALHIRCGVPGGEVSVVRQPGNETITLHDDGAAPDRIAADGIYAADWTATLHQTSALTYPGGDVEPIHVWPQLSNLMSSPTPTAAEWFGRTLAAEGTNVFVGAPRGGSGCTGQGVVYVFDRDTRALVRTIEPPLQPTPIGPLVIASEFGAALAVDGGRLLVGAPGGLGGCFGCGLGEAMLFDAATGELLHILQPLEPPSSFWHDIGESVAIAGNNVVVGIPHSQTPAGPTDYYDGLVLLFDATTGAHLTTLIPESTLTGSFGQSVAASADRVAVGSANMVHLYNADQSSPQFGQLIATYDGQFYASGGEFGAAIAFVGQYLVIAAPTAWNVQGSQANGAVFVFDGPTLVRTLLNPVPIGDPSLVTSFGASLAPAGDAIVVGAPEANFAIGRGSAYVFRVDDGTLVKTVQAIPSLAGSGFGASVAAVDDVTIVTAPRAFEGAGFGAAFTFSPTLGFPEPLAFTPIPSKSFSLRDDSQPPVDLGRRAIRFKSLTAAAARANRIVPPARDAGGDPTIHGAVLTVYNAAGLTLDAVTVPLPATGPTAGEGWARLGPSSAPAGYGYRNRSPNGPISRVLVKRDRIIVRGGKNGWGYSLDEAAQGRVAVRLQLGDAPPWCAVIPASASRVDRVDLFVGQRDATPPAACPPLP